MARFVPKDNDKKYVYRNNPRLRRPDVIIPITKDQEQEYIKCAQSCDYFLNKYYKIISLDHGEILYKAFGFQQRISQAFEDHRRVIVMMPRQQGKTTVVVGYLLWYVLFHKMKKVAILANEADNAKRILGDLRFAYERLPLWMQQGVVTWNKTEIELENGSKAISDATTGAAIRGRSMNIVYLDEWAFVPTNVADDFYASVLPTLSSGETTKIFITSTPKGMNRFYKDWMAANAKGEHWSGFYPVEVHYTDHPKRNQKWADEQLRLLGPERFAEEYLCQFMGGSNALISSSVLSQIPIRTPDTQEDGLDIFAEPQKDHRYVLVCDPSEGAGQDYSAFSIFDVTKLPYRIIAKYRSKTVSPLVLPRTIVHCANRYNKAYVLIETNGVGTQVGYSLFNDYEYENLLTSVPKQRQGAVLKIGYQGTTTNWGIRTTTQTKSQGCANVKALIESKKLTFEDGDIVEELSKFTWQGKQFKAEEGEHDDVVMTLVNFGWLAKQPMFTNLSSIDPGSRENIEEESKGYVPFILHDDHSKGDDTWIDAGGMVWTLEP